LIFLFCGWWCEVWTAPPRFSQQHNAVTTSRTVVLSLEAGDRVSIVQQFPSFVPDTDLDFCGVLLRPAQVGRQGQQYHCSNCNLW